MELWIRSQDKEDLIKVDNKNRRINENKFRQTILFDSRILVR